MSDVDVDAGADWGREDEDRYADAGNCAKCWTIDTAIRHHRRTNCPHRYKPKPTDTQKKQARAAMKKEEEDDY